MQGERSVLRSQREPHSGQHLRLGANLPGAQGKRATAGRGRFAATGATWMAVRPIASVTWLRKENESRSNEQPPVKRLVRDRSRARMTFVGGARAYKLTQ
jgi:hypothetical protein